MIEGDDSCGLDDGQTVYTCQNSDKVWVSESERDAACSDDRETSKINFDGWQNGCQPEDACFGNLFNPVFEASDRFGIDFFFTSEPPHFDFDVPAFLPSREDRLDPKKSFGQFLWDVSPVADLVAEEFIVDLFDEYMGCAVRHFNDYTMLV